MQLMKLLYSKNGLPVAGVSAAVRNPAYFECVETGVTEVLADAGYPAVRAAYEAAGVSFEVLKPSEKRPEADGHKLSVAELKLKLTERGVSVPPNAKKDELLALFEQSAGGGDGE